MMLAAQHGGRQQAEAVLLEGETADKQWREAKAREMWERHPGRYRTFDDALHDVPDPLGASGAFLSGSVDDVVGAVRWVNPFWKVRNTGDDLPDASVTSVASGPPGWRRAVEQ